MTGPPLLYIIIFIIIKILSTSFMIYGLTFPLRDFSTF